MNDWRSGVGGEESRVVVAANAEQEEEERTLLEQKPIICSIFCVVESLICKDMWR
jgi:hypothetical protein